MQKPKKTKKIALIFTGKKTDITLPSGNTVTIRELNGEDEEILSSESAADAGENIYNFLTSITEHDKLLGTKPTPEDIKNWPVNDKYYLLYKQRLLNHGPELSFSAMCPVQGCSTHINNYTEDLSIFDADLSKQITDEDEVTDSQVKRYPNGDSKTVEFELSSGKKIKYSIINGVLEIAALELKDETKNAVITIRKPFVSTEGGKWVKVTNYRAFSGSEMSEIRTNIRMNDAPFGPVIRYHCPKCKTVQVKSIFLIPTFFYPEASM